jgi:hypothetical protein
VASRLAAAKKTLQARLGDRAGLEMGNSRPWIVPLEE